MGPDDPKWGQEDFFLLIQTLLTFWAERILILRMFDFLIFWGSQISALGPLGPTHLGPAWAHPLGPSVGHLGRMFATDSGHLNLLVKHPETKGSMLSLHEIMPSQAFPTLCVQAH